MENLSKNNEVVDSRHVLSCEPVINCLDIRKVHDNLKLAGCDALIFHTIYKNYKEGDVIDKSLMNLTYDKSVTRYPGGCLDWNLLFDIVRPRA